MRTIAPGESFPKWCFYEPQQCVVEVIRVGHFPDTAMVKLPNGETVECYLRDLKDRSELPSPVGGDNTARG